MIVITTIINGCIDQINVPLGNRASLEVQHEIVQGLKAKGQENPSVRVIERVIPDPPKAERYSRDDEDE